MTPDPSSLLDRGLAAHREGRLAQAEAAYREALGLAPGHPEALHLLGLARLGQGDPSGAVRCLAAAREQCPEDPEITYNLAAAHLAAGTPSEAIPLLEAVLRGDPGHAQARFNLGEALRRTGDLDGAVAHLECAAQDLQGLPEVPNALGLAHRALGRPREARAAFQAARAIDPGFLEAGVNLGLLDLDTGDLAGALARWEPLADHLESSPVLAYNLGAALMKRGEPAKAVDLFRKALAAAPDFTEAGLGEGHALRLSGDPGAALSAFEAVLAAAPGHGEALEGKGQALLALGREAEARASFEAALASTEGDLKARARVLAGLGSSHRAAGQEAEAEARLREALDLDPGLPEASLNLGVLFTAQGRLAEAYGALLLAASLDRSPAARIALATAVPAIIPSREDIARERASLSEFLDWLEEEDLLSKDPLQDFLLPTFFNAYRGLGNRDLHQRLARILALAHPALAWMAPHCLEPCDWQGQRPLRIGFISRHFKNHSIGKTSLGLIQETDPARFTRIVFSFEEPHDETGLAIREAADRFVQLPFDLAEARRQIAAEDLDVLFYQDLGMEPVTWLLAFARLAHVQCVSFGHPDTTGIPNVDWWVSSDAFEAEGAEAHYSERLHRLQDVAPLAYYHRPEEPGPRDRARYGLPEGVPIFLCPQTLFKLHPDFDGLVEGILRGDPDGLVVLLRRDIAHWRAQLESRFASRFPEHLERVRFMERLDEDDFNGLLRLADVVLDTPHFNGMNTTLQAFAMGTPVVTLPTDFQRGRHVLGMYRRMGWTELAAPSPERYVELALRLARDPAFRAAAVAEIEARRHVLFEDISVVRQFEAFYEGAARASQEPLPRDLRIAVITPYHGEPEAMLRQGHESVLAQTCPATHILVSDGPGAAFVKRWQAQAMELPVAARDNGHTPRAIGALAAIRQGFDAIAYLDADNWLHPRHLEHLVRCHLRTGAPVAVSRRTYRRWEDGSPMPFDVDPSLESATVDTGCYLFTRPAFRFQPLWSLMPKPFTPVGSRVFYNALRESGIPLAFDGAATLNFRSQYLQTYTALGEPPPDIAKTGAWDEAANALHLEQPPEVRVELAPWFPGAGDVRAARWRCPLPIFGFGPTPAEIDAVTAPEPPPEPWPAAAPRRILLVTDLAVDPRKGGSEQRFQTVLRTLLEDGHEIHHFSLAPGTEAPPSLKALEAAHAAYRFGGGMFEALPRLPAFDLLWFAHLWNVASLDAAGMLRLVLRRLAPGPFQVVFDANDYLYKAQAPLLPALERAALQKRYNALVRQADAAIFVSGLDRAQALRFAGGSEDRSHVVSSAVEPVPAACAVPFEARQGLCFFGGDHAGNVDAIQHFVDEILPGVATGDPSLQLHLYGIGMDPARLEVPEALASRVAFHGWVENLPEALARHRVQVVPVRLGAGIKIKVLDSLAHGTPVVGTPRGFEGLGLEDGVSALVAATPEAFAAQVLRLHGDRALWMRLQAGGLDHVRGRFGPDGLRHALRAVLGRLERQPPAGR